MGDRRTVLFAAILILGCHTLRATASAIPMWEFLSRDEKMSHLFKVFSQQVAAFCADSSMPDCNKNLLVSGLRNLANMDENQLDRLDPYQRDAKEIIWRAMAKNGYATRVAHEPNDSYFTSGTDSVATSGSETNGLGEETVAAHEYVQLATEHTGPHLIGPMVIRVYPDGRPVPEDSGRPLPRDEDIKEFRHTRIPSIKDIEANRNNLYEKQSKRNAFPEDGNHRQANDESTCHQKDHSLFKRRLLQEIVAKRKLSYY